MPDAITKEDEKRHLEDDTTCPRCRGCGITSEPFQHDLCQVWRKRTCANCGLCWQDVYKLHSVAIINGTYGKLKQLKE